MNKKAMLLTIPALMALNACHSNNNPNDEPVLGMANPASVYCVEQGGRLEVKKDADGGEYALCHLPDGRVIDEWEFYRANHK